MPRTSPPFSIDSAARRLAGALLFISKPSRSWSPSVEKTVDPILRHFLQPLSKPLKASLVAAVIDPHLLHHHTLASGLFHWADLQPNFSHTAQTYHSLLKSLSLSRQPQLIPPLLETARGRQVPLYSSSYQIAISSLLLLGKSIEAAELIDSATRSSDEELRASLYNSLLAGLSSDGFLDVARKLLGRMLRRGIIPSVVDFGVFMGNVCKLEGLDGVLSVLDEAKNLNFGFTGSVVASVIIDSLCRAERIEDAQCAFEILRNRGFKPDFIAYRLVSKSYRLVGLKAIEYVSPLPV